GRPHVILKLAVSSDGKAGLEGRRPVAITGEPAQEFVHLLRSSSDAVLTGIGTALADDPLLTCRLPGMADRSPVRVVLDSGLRRGLGSRLVAGARQTPLWIITGADASSERERALREGGADVLRVSTSGGRIDLVAALMLLAKRGITR